MKAIYWKELKSFFSSFTGYAYISFFLLTLGLYFTAIIASLAMFWQI